MAHDWRGWGEGMKLETPHAWAIAGAQLLSWARQAFRLRIAAVPAVDWAVVELQVTKPMATTYFIQL
jgi:hypothetical protein